MNLHNGHGPSVSWLPHCRSAGPPCRNISRSSKTAGLVAEHAEGTRRIYELNEAGLSALRDQLDTFWSRALTRYRNVIDDSTEENP